MKFFESDGFTERYFYAQCEIKPMDEGEEWKLKKQPLRMSRISAEFML